MLTVKRVGKYSSILAAGPRHLTVYAFEGDRANPSQSTCTESCASRWPPVTTDGAPVAGEHVEAAKLATIRRPDGSAQVIYNDHPLYYFSGDRSIGDIGGQGMQGLWYVLAPEGIEILRP